MLLLRQQSTLKPLVPITLPTYSNVIDDAVRNAGTSGDGAAVPGGVGVWGATTPLYVQGFETNDGGWGATTTGMTVAQSAAQHKFGTKSLAASCDGSVANQGVVSPAFSGATPGSVYSVGVWAYLPTLPSGNVRLQWDWGDSGGAGLGTVTVDTTPTGTGWQRFVAQNQTAPASAAKCNGVRVRLPTAQGSAYTFYVDAVQFEPGAIATPYIGDGNASRSAARIQVPASVLSAQQGWVFAAVKMGVGNSVVGPRLVSFSDGTTNNRIEMFAGGGGWQSRKVQGGVAGANATLTDAYNLGDVRVLGIRYDPQTIALSGQGSAWPTNQASNANVPVGLNTLTLGSFADGTSPLDSALLWVMVGRTPPENPAILNAFGATPPGLGALNPAWKPTFYWDCVTSTAYAAA